VPDTEVEGLLRRLAPQVLGAVVRRYGHFDTAEDAVQEGLLAAAMQWPKDGLPDNPRGWLITVASRRLTNLLRSEQARQRREDTVARWILPDQWLSPAADRPTSASPESDDTLPAVPVLSPFRKRVTTLRVLSRYLAVPTLTTPLVRSSRFLHHCQENPGLTRCPRAFSPQRGRVPAQLSVPMFSPCQAC
jgi:predicted RNA polymerase sigma factor